MADKDTITEAFKGKEKDRLPTHSEGNSRGGYWYKNSNLSVSNFKDSAVFDMVGNGDEIVYIFRGLLRR